MLHRRPRRLAAETLSPSTLLQIGTDQVGRALLQNTTESRRSWQFLERRHSLASHCRCAVADAAEGTIVAWRSSAIPYWPVWQTSGPGWSWTAIPCHWSPKLSEGAELPCSFQWPWLKLWCTSCGRHSLILAWYQSCWSYFLLNQ